MAKSVVDYAMEHLDSQIADLQRAKEILGMAAGAAAASLSGGSEPPKVRKPRGPNKKRGLPAEEPSL
jgi:hypothetical protein